MRIREVGPHVGYTVAITTVSENLRTKAGAGLRFGLVELMHQLGAGSTAHLGVDEKAITKGRQYMTLVRDLQAATVQYIGEDRKEESLTAYFAAFDQEQRGRIGPRVRPVGRTPWRNCES